MKKLIFLFSFLLLSSLSFGQASGKVISNKPSGGTIGLDTINLYSQLNLKQTTSGQTITVANLTTGGKIIYIRNIGSVAITLSPGGIISPGYGVMLGWTGLAWNVTYGGNGEYLKLSGGSMTGNINFNDENDGITWNSGTTISGNNSGFSIYDNTNNNNISTSSTGVTIQSDNGAYLSVSDNTVLSDGVDYLELNNGLAYLSSQNGNFAIDENGFAIYDDVNTSSIISNSLGIVVTDGSNGNYISMKSDGIKLSSASNVNFVGTNINASTVPYFDASKNLISSTVTPTELGYVSGTTSSIQTQLNALSGGGALYVKKDGTVSLTGNWYNTQNASFSSLGVGTSSTTPVSALHVVETSTSTPRGYTQDQYNNGTNSSQYNHRKARGTFATPLTIVTGDVLSNSNTWGYEGTNFIQSGSIRTTSIGTIGTNRVPSKIDFMTSTDASPSVLTTALTLDQSQNAIFTNRVTSISQLINGTTGTGYIEFGQQSVNPTAPSSTGFRLFANSSGSPAWAKKNGSDTYVRQFSSTNTADRTYTLQDNSYTLAGIDISQSFTASQSFSTSFTASSGSTAFNPILANPTINQTGTAVGTVRGFYYNPTVTSILGTHYAFESTAGDLFVGGTGKIMLNDAGTPQTALDRSGTSALRLGSGFTSVVLGVSGFTRAASFTFNVDALSFAGSSSSSQGLNVTIANSGTGTGDWYSYKASGSWAKSSVIATHSSFESLVTINQTATATGDVSLFYANPTVTSIKSNIYGFRSSLASGPTGGGVAWNIYADGTAPNAFTGRSFFGGTTSPTALVHLAAGTATASTAPLKFTSGANLTSVENGTVEYDGTNYFASSGSTRYTLAKTLTNTATLDFPSTLPASMSTLTITVTGASDGDAVSLGIPNSSTVSGAIFSATVISANTVTITYYNSDGLSSGNPASGTFRVSVLKY